MIHVCCNGLLEGPCNDSVHTCVSGGLSAPFSQNLLNPSGSLPPGGFHAQELMIASNSAPPIISIPKTYRVQGRAEQHPITEAMPVYQPMPQGNSSDPEYLPEHESASRAVKGRGSSEDDPTFMDAADHVGMAKKQRRLAEKNRHAFAWKPFHYA